MANSREGDPMLGLSMRTATQRSRYKSYFDGLTPEQMQALRRGVSPSGVKLIDTEEVQTTRPDEHMQETIKRHLEDNYGWDDDE